jgi:hypothetical protein
MNEQKIVTDATYDALCAALEKLRDHKPNDRSAADRSWAVTITMMEQAIAYFDVWVRQEVGCGKEK